MSGLTMLIIRHAEKPQPDSPAPGLGLDGLPDPRSLTIRGWQRAGAWAVRLGALPATADYPRPGAVYACNPEHGPTAAPPSRRAWQTIAPLAERLGLQPSLQWRQGDEAGLAAEAGSLTGTVLIAWEHKRIVEGLLPALLGAQRPEALPAAWDKRRFDVVLRLDRAAPGSEWSFRQMCPLLLAGDGDLPL